MRPPLAHRGEEDPVQHPGLLFEAPNLHGEAGRTKGVRTAASAGIRVADGRHHAGQARSGDGCRAWRRLAVVGARLERDIEGRAAGC